MKYFPRENITYKTNLEEVEIYKRLKLFVEPKKNIITRIIGKGATKPYEGIISKRSFEIQRIIEYRNALLPQIIGKIEKKHEGITIHVNMMLDFFVIAFLFLWFCLLGFFCVFGVIHMFDSEDFNFTVLIPIAMLLFVYKLILYGFRYESNKSKEDLKNLFEAEMLEK